MNFKVVVIGGSAGSLEAILKIVSGLTYQQQAVFIIIVHRKNDGDSILADLLTSKTMLPVKEVEDKEPLIPGTVYIAPSNYHLLVENEQEFSLDGSEKIHYSRPSIDVCFESVAEVFGGRTIGVLLSGANADGAKGLKKIKANGGFTIVQDPATADVGYMPQQAINEKGVDKILRADEMADFIKALLG